MRRAALAIALLVLAGTPGAGGQTPVQALPQATAQKPAEAPPQPGTAGYTYDPAGRRDPFVSLLGRGSDPRATGARPAGLAGMLIQEVSLKGIVRDRAGFFALLLGPDNKTYVVRAGDRLFDGSIKAILGDAVVFSQDVNDPLSLVKQREVRRNLRSNEENRG